MIGLAEYAAALTTSQLEREIAVARGNGADDDYVTMLERVLEERRSIGNRETEPPPAPESAS